MRVSLAGQAVQPTNAGALYPATWQWSSRWRTPCERKTEHLRRRFGVLRQAVRQQDGDERDRDDHDRRDVRHRLVPRPRQLAEDPDRQRRLLPGGEGRDDDLVEREGESEYCARQQRRGED